MSGQPAVAEGQGEKRADPALLAAEQGFWDAFNRCDGTAMAGFFTEDAEFYHDITGLVQGRDGVARSMIAGPCDDVKTEKLRREAVGAIHFEPLAGGYALLEGDQRFLVSRNGGTEAHGSIARFVAIWAQRDGRWQMKRVASFAHRPDLPALVEVARPEAELAPLAGTYRDPSGTPITVALEGARLKLTAGPGAFELVPLGGDRFGTPGRWLEFRLTGTSLEVIEEGRSLFTAAREPG